MRAAVHAATSLLALTACLPCFADPATGQPPWSDSAFVAGALDSGALDLYRAGASESNHIRPEGLVGNNSADHSVAGMNSISAGAFANASGLPVVIQNSGANVLIQNATIVNIQLQ